MFEEAYLGRAPVFGRIPTACVADVLRLLPDGAVVADLGCGDGRDALFVLDHGCVVHAHDVSPAAIDFLQAEATARGLDERLTATVMDVRGWQPRPESFDCVYGVTILDHLASEDHIGLFQSVTGALKPGGIVVWEMHSDRDPGVDPTSSDISEFSDAIQSRASANYLLRPYDSGWRILYYSDRMEEDTDHGEPHYHGFATIVAMKE